MAPALLFGALDYALFAMMLAISVAVGVWFGICGRKNNIKAVDYLMGGKSMGIFPVGVSLAASHISGITIMGVPAEIYTHGVQYMLACISGVFMGLVMDYIYIPVFYDLQTTSIFEYLQVRFNRHVRLMASILFTLQVALFLPIVVYVPSLAFEQVSGADLHIVAVVVCVVCIFYTMLGGLKAVVWTDFLQAFVMVGALVAVMILGIIRVGGLGRLWRINAASGRLDVSFDPNPFTRNTLWTVVFGATVSWLCVCTNQGTMQKFLALPTRRRTRQGVMIFIGGIILFKFLSCFAGLIMYANYHDCDPLKTGAVGRPDQLLPYFVMDTASHIPGLPGLFIAGVFSAALSSLSSSLNCLSAIIYEDFVAPRFHGKLSDKTVNYIMMGIVGLFGVLCVVLIFVVERLGAVLELVYSVNSITTGALFGLFTIGMVFPSADSRGALAGSIAALLVVGWVVIGAQVEAWSGRMHDPWFPSSMEGCAANVTLSALAAKHDVAPPDGWQPPFLLYRLSYLYLSALGLIVVLVVGLSVSAIWRRFRPDAPHHSRRPHDLRVFAPFVRRGLAAAAAAALVRSPAANGVHADPSEKEQLAMNPRD